MSLPSRLSVWSGVQLARDRRVGDLLDGDDDVHRSPDRTGSGSGRAERGRTAGDGARFWPARAPSVEAGAQVTSRRAEDGDGRARRGPPRRGASRSRPAPRRDRVPVRPGPVSQPKNAAVLTVRNHGSASVDVRPRGSPRSRSGSRTRSPSRAAVFRPSVASAPLSTASAPAIERRRGAGRRPGRARTRRRRRRSCRGARRRAASRRRRRAGSPAKKPIATSAAATDTASSSRTRRGSHVSTVVTVPARYSAPTALAPITTTSR